MSRRFIKIYHKATHITRPTKQEKVMNFLKHTEVMTQRNESACNIFVPDLLSPFPSFLSLGDVLRLSVCSACDSSCSP